ncbi:hypothetical protein R3P38DRAFT_3512351 [Favolaschia claudopus]|uniref:Uncharacterized protein n=1 Tax=Favolaschia claudopus TaxID=2862362 RepID=A0AAV9Z089_9AGAR
MYHDSDDDEPARIIYGPGTARTPGLVPPLRRALFAQDVFHEDEPIRPVYAHTMEPSQEYSPPESPLAPYTKLPLVRAWTSVSTTDLGPAKSFSREFNSAPGPSPPSETRLSIAATATNLLNISLNPFRNKTVFGFMKWMWTGSILKSVGEGQRIVDLINSGDFCQEDLKGFDFRTETAKFDKIINPVGSAVGNASGIKDGWREIDVPIEVPDGEKHAASDSLPTYNVPGLHFRNLTQAIKAAIEGPSSRHFHCTPFKQFWHRSKDEDPIPIYDEIYSSLAFINAHEKIQREAGESGCDLERVVLALMFWSDSTHLANFGTASLWPLYLFFGNQSKWVRSKPRSAACHHVAYMPKFFHPILEGKSQQNAMNSTESLELPLCTLITLRMGKSGIKALGLVSLQFSAIHRDNFVEDRSQLIPGGFHFVATGWSSDLKNRIQVVKGGRSATQPKIFIVNLRSAKEVSPGAVELSNDIEGLLHTIASLLEDYSELLPSLTARMTATEVVEVLKAEFDKEPRMLVHRANRPISLTDVERFCIRLFPN